MYIIAEMAWAHDGSIDKAIQIMHAAKDAGAHAFGIHVTDMPNYMVTYYGSGPEKVSSGKEDRKVYDYLEEINISNDEWLQLAAEAEKIGMDLVVMANDVESVRFTAEKIKPAYLVLASAGFVEPPLLDAVVEAGLPIIMRIGGATLGEIEKVLNFFRSKSPDREIVLLYGHQNYPTLTEHNHLNVIPSLANLFGCKVGLADHHDADDEFAVVMPCVARALGCDVIEKHITFNRSEKGEDFESALNGDEFKRMVTMLEQTEAALGQKHFPVSEESLQRYRGVVRKKAIYKSDLPEGHKLTADDFKYKRSDLGLQPDQVDVVIGRPLVKAVSMDNPVLMEDFGC